MRKVLFILLVTALVFLYFYLSLRKGSDYYNPPIRATHFNGKEFTGSKTCSECHLEIYNDHIRTAHYNTSAPVSPKNMKGSFEKGNNTIELADGLLTMVKDRELFYQKTELKSGKDLPTQKFDIVIGSGVKGQSYLTWDDNSLYQLQASYYPGTNKWFNSPGYPPTAMRRIIDDSCIKCHVTFATNIDFSGMGNRYKKEQIVYGIDCERCHGPSRQHVIHHRSNPQEKIPLHTIGYSTFTRQQRLDACAQCHSGLRENILKGNSFSYIPGEPLDEHSRNYYTTQSDSTLDVHGNQYGLLIASKCFQKSGTMDCTTCHDPHKNQRGNDTHFIQKCKGCHEPPRAMCTANNGIRNEMKDNCISCHMPSSPSNIMAFQLNPGKNESPVFIRTHQIDIYEKSKWDKGK